MAKKPNPFTNNNNNNNYRSPKHGKNGNNNINYNTPSKTQTKPTTSTHLTIMTIFIFLVVTLAAVLAYSFQISHYVNLFSMYFLFSPPSWSYSSPSSDPLYNPLRCTFIINFILL